MYISSDTNIWIDFKTINAMSLPFRLQCDYIMSNDAIQDELLSTLSYSMHQEDQSSLPNARPHFV